MKNRSPAPLASLLLSAACSRSGMFSSFCLFSFHLVVSRADEPQNGMDHEEGKRAGQQQIHKQPDKVECRIELAIARVGVRLILDETGIGARVTPATR